MPTRQEVYEAIDSERDYQKEVWGSVDGIDNPMEVGSFLALLDIYLADAKDQFRREMKPEKEAIETMRKIASIAVNCMEQHGAPKR